MKIDDNDETSSKIVTALLNLQPCHAANMHLKPPLLRDAAPIYLYLYLYISLHHYEYQRCP